MVLAWGAVRVAAQSGELEGLPLQAVRHQPANSQVTPLETAALERITALRAGEPYSSRKIREGIERLFATGRFADIQVDAEREAEGVAVTFLTRGRYFVGAVSVRGVEAPPSEIQLRSAARLRLGSAYSEEDLGAAVEGVREALQNEGFYQATIVPRIVEHPETNQVDIRFEVQPGARAEFGTVEVTGASVFPAERLREQAQWEAGERFSSRQVQDGLSRLQDLYRDVNYLEASVRIARRTFHPETGRVDLELDVTAGPRIEITVTGANLDRSEMERLIPIFEERTIDEDLLREGERNLANYFEAQGYFDVAVQYVREPLPSGDLRVEYQVELGMQHRLREVQIQGNQYFNDETLRERMRIDPASLTQRSGRFSTNLLEQDLAAIRAVYQTNGFPRVRVTAQRIGLEQESDGALDLVVTVEEGRQILVGDFSLTGNRAFPQEALENYINAASGQPYSESVIASDRDNLLTFYYNEGFLEARFDWRSTPSEDGSRMNLEYIVEEGEREFVRRVYVSGLENTRLGIVTRQLQFRDGDPLSQGQLIETQRRLYDLGIFSQVEMAIQNPAGAERDRTVLVYLEEARRYTVKIGLGADVGRFGGSSGDVTDVEGDAEISPNISFDVTRLNVGGRPHTASLRTRFSTLQKRAGLTYLAPRFLNYPWLNATATALFDETRDVRTFTARRLETALQFETQWSRATTFFNRYAFRRVTVDTSTLRIAEDQIPIAQRPVLVGMLSQTWYRDTRDDPTDARRGVFSSADFGVAAKQIGSEASFLRLVLQNSSYHPFRQRFTIARSFQLGMMSPFGKGREVNVGDATIRTTDIPIPERFFAGGGNSHRGFAVNQAGPRDLETGFAVGGNALLFHSLEFRFPVWGETLSGVLFHDMGNVFAKVEDMTLRLHQRNEQDYNYLAHAVGFGLRYRTPVGPVRFDMGYNLNPTRVATRVGTPEAGVQTLSRWQFLVSIGQSF
jgi:outer membrane protein assembly complex protein YaeT